jgi:hypothetical protein
LFGPRPHHNQKRNPFPTSSFFFILIPFLPRKKKKRKEPRITYLHNTIQKKVDIDRQTAKKKKDQMSNKGLG